MNTASSLRMIIDVRTPEEYSDGHYPGSVNIPFSLLPLKLEDLKQQNQEITLCCASGGRSRAAARLLHNAGIECVDAGPWQNLHSMYDGAQA